MKKIILLISIVLLLLGCKGKDLEIPDLSVPNVNLDTFMKIRGSLNPEEETVFYWSGAVHGFVDGEYTKKLFRFEGYNIAKLVKVEDGYQLLTREVSFYKDVKTDTILATWDNPYTEKNIDVVHVWNDPVNQYLKYEYSGYKMSLPYTDLGDQVCFNMDLFLRYPSPLPKDEYPENSNSDFYEAGELFQFFTTKESMTKDSDKLPCYISWSRISPWLPWMEMGDRSGHMIYHCRGKKLENGYEQLPEHIKNYVETNNPIFATAPDEYTKPNETSWTYFKKIKNKEAVKE